MTQETPSLYIDGEWIKGLGEPLTSINPATGATLWTGRSANKAGVDLAVTIAKKALYSWSHTSLESRIDHLHRFRERLEAEKEVVATLISQETGKPLWESRSEVQSMISKVQISVDAYSDRRKEKSVDLDKIHSMTRYRPHGVVAIFGPFNLPGHLPNGHIIPALLAGNTIVFKPSEKTPLVAEKIVQLWEQVDLPNGVLNLVQGGKNTGISLASHPDLDGLFFTGGYPTGKAIHRLFAGHPEKILALEMGGNNPLIIAEVQDLKAAAYMTIQSAFITSGQRCTCARRLIVPSGSKYDEFLDVLTEMITKIRVGGYHITPEPFMGPVITEESAAQLLKAQSNLISNGATPLITMEATPSRKTMLSPGLIDVSSIRKKPDNEYFGPLLLLVRVSNFENAMNEANRTKYGLSAGIISQNKALYDQFLIRARAGIINWNRPLTGASSLAPFGGVGKSGNHRPSGYFASDYCSYPVASLESEELTIPETITPGIEI